MAVPANQTCATSEEILTVPFSVVVNTTEAGDSPASPDTNCGSGNSFNSVWYDFLVPLGVTRLRASVDDDSFESIITLWSGPCGALVDEIQCSFSGAPIDFVVVAGTRYRFLLTSFDPGGIEALSFVLEYPVPEGDFCAVLSCTTPPPDPGTVRYIRRLRRFPLPFDRSLFVYVDRIEFLIQAGMGNTSGQGSDPMIELRFSANGGETWGPWLFMPAGKIGEYSLRPVVNRIGKMRNGVCEIAVTDPIAWYFLACYVNADEEVE